MSHNRAVKMFEGQAGAVAIVTIFLVGTIAPHDGPHTICKDYPSGAAANVSHNRPVRMFERPAVAVAIITIFLVGTIALHDGPHTIRKDYPSGAAANVSHNRAGRMFVFIRPGRMPGDLPLPPASQAGGSDRMPSLDGDPGGP